MQKWEKWAKVSTGPYRGKPELTMAGIGESGYMIHVRDRASNVIKLLPAAPGRTGVIVNTGGHHRSSCDGTYAQGWFFGDRQ